MTEIKPCIWTEDIDPGENNYWSTSCDNEFVLVAGDPKENGFIYCPYCGNKIEQTSGE